MLTLGAAPGGEWALGRAKRAPAHPGHPALEPDRAGDRWLKRGRLCWILDPHTVDPGRGTGMQGGWDMAEKPKLLLRLAAAVAASLLVAGCGTRLNDAEIRTAAGAGAPGPGQAAPGT